jgi:hypothetical protein
MIRKNPQVGWFWKYQFTVPFLDFVSNLFDLSCVLRLFFLEIFVTRIVCCDGVVTIHKAYLLIFIPELCLWLPEASLRKDFVLIIIVLKIIPS